MDDASHLATALAGRYEVQREIGRGGMATVYLARDVKHERNVALKVLNPELGAVLGVERFLSEIRVTANLQHPNLLPLFDSGEANGLLFYVMPYIEGESLRARIDREKQLPIDDALHIAMSVAGALDYAHRHGVIHRDLKPENILMHEGEPLVADFGIALAVSNAGGNRITQTGLSLGTPQYMSPEQATGDRVIDGRTDIYSLGAVLYEMLTGEPPHSGTTAQAIIAKVLTDRPRSIRLSRDTVPAHVEAAIEKALAKLPADRWRSAHDFAAALAGKAVPLAMTQKGERGRGSQRRWIGTLPWVAALAASIALGAWGTLRPRPDTRLPARFVVTLDAKERPSFGLDVSRDGSRIAYASTEQILIRSIGELSFHPTVGTEGASSPRFSRSGEWLSYFTQEGRLYRMDANGGSRTLVTDSAVPPAGSAWLTDDDVVVTKGAAPGVGGALRVISLSRGTSRVLTTLGKGEFGHGSPIALPDNAGVVFCIITNARATDAELAFTTLEGKITRLGIRGIKPQYVAGHLVFVLADGSLAQVAFDLKHHRLTSGVKNLGESLLIGPGGEPNFAVSENGTLFYARTALPNDPVLVDHAGSVRSIAMDRNTYFRPRFSPDGRRVALDTHSGTDGEIWVYDIATSTPQRLIVGQDVHQPEWRADGKALAFTARLGAAADEGLYTIPIDGSTARESVFVAKGDHYDGTWTPDGKSLVYIDERPGQEFGIVRLSDRKPTTWLAPTGGTLLGPRVSPDGKWITYWSNESGRSEIYVRPFPAAGGYVQVSSGGGTEPIWSRDGHELFYRQSNKLIAATILTSPQLAVGTRRMLFEHAFVTDGNHTNYDVSPDGKSFVFLQEPQDQAQLFVVLNWDKELQADRRSRP
jgi:eukaryotic-like serine/threonine-protein kinase